MLKKVAKITGITLLSLFAFIALFVYFSFINLQEMMAKEDLTFETQLH